MAFERMCGAALGLALFALSGVAQAQLSAAKRGTARELMAEARQLRDRGDLEGALSRFNAADAIMNVPTTAFEVAVTQAELGKLVEARESVLRVLGMAQAPDEPAPFSEARAKAQALHQQLLERIGSIVFTAGDVSEADELELKVDGEIVPRAMLGLRFRINPGKHQVVARSRSRELWRELEVGQGQSVEVPLTFQKPPLALETHESRTVPPPKAPRSVRRVVPQTGTSTLVYVGVGVGAVGIVIGSVAGVSAITHKNSAAEGCIDRRCPPSTWRDLQTARNMAITSNVGFLIGGAGVAFAVGVFLLDRPSYPEQAWLVAPEVGPQGASVNVEGRF